MKDAGSPERSQTFWQPDTNSVLLQMVMTFIYFYANSPCLSELSLESEMNFSKLHEAASASRRLQSMEVPWPF